MAKGSRTQPRHRPRAQTRPKWAPGDVIELLSCLDYSLEHKINFESAIIGHLKRTTGKHFTDKQVSNRLEKEWHDYGRQDSPSFHDLLSEGSACLDGYSDVDRENIRKAIGRMGPPPRQTRLRSMFSALRSPGRSHTLSGQSQLSKASSSSTQSIHATPEFEGLGEVLTNDSGRGTAGGKVEADQPCEAASMRTRDSIEGDIVNSTTETGYTRMYVHAASQTSPTAEENTVQVQQLERELEASHRENVELTNYIFTLSNRLSAAERECLEIQHSSRAAVAHQDNSTMVRNLRYESSLLKDQMSRMRDQLQSGLAMTTTDHNLGPPDKTIREEIDFIKADISDACASVELASPIPVSIQDQTHQDMCAIESWAQRIAHCGFSQLISMATRSGLSELELLRSFAAAGLCSLVFESRFPDFIVTESPLLDQYRKQIMTRSGPGELFKFDLLAHRSLMAEPYFKSHILQEKAKTLTAQFVGTLRPLMPRDSPSIVDFCPGELFHEAFVRSLDLKSKLLLSGSKYKLVYFFPGDSFESETMIRDGDTSEQFTPSKGIEKGGPPGKQDSGPRKTIKLCIFPALFLVSDRGSEHPQGGEVNNMEQCVVGYDNILAGDNAGNWGSAVLIVKAVVLV